MVTTETVEPGSFSLMRTASSMANSSKGLIAAAIPSRLPASPTRPPQGPFPPAAFFVTAINGTAVPSDSRCAAPDFAFGLYGSPCLDLGHADGSPVFRASPCTRAAPSTPPGPAARHPPDLGTADVAFAVT